jgi:prepilin-type N-terminal cleavage/methylation domain-containing protein
MMKKIPRTRPSLPRDSRGFSLVEVVLSIALLGAVVLGLAQFFTLGLMNNLRAERISNAVFLVQQQIELLRGLTSEELNALGSGASDEQVDVNNDGTLDFRRITQIQPTGSDWDIKILVFSSEKLTESVSNLLSEPQRHRVRAQMSTVIAR